MNISQLKLRGKKFEDDDDDNDDNDDDDNDDDDNNNNNNNKIHYNEKRNKYVNRCTISWDINKIKKEAERF